MGNIANADIGVCSVTFNGIDLGHTKGGVFFSREMETTDLTVDQYGSTPIDIILTGDNLTVRAILAEETFQNLAIAYPGAASQSGSLGNKQPFGVNAGASLRQFAGQLVLHEIDRGASDTSRDIVLYKAVSSEPVELNYEVDNQRVLEVTFRAMIDETKTVGNRLGHIGISAVS